MKKLPILILATVILSIFCLLYFQPSSAQGIEPDTPRAQQERRKRVPEMITNAKFSGARFERKELFQREATPATQDANLRSAVSDGSVIVPVKSATRNFGTDAPEFMTLVIPGGKDGTTELELVKVDIFAPGFSVKTSVPTSEPLDRGLGVHYRGIVKDNEDSLVAISIFDNEVMGFVSTATDGNSVIGRLNGKNPDNKHIFYNARDLKSRPTAFCNTPDTDVSIPDWMLEEPVQGITKCVKIYIEANHDIFFNKGSVANVNTYLTGVFNQSATLYSNEGIAISLSEIFVWNSTSPYTGTTSLQQLTQFRTTRLNFNGDLAHLVSFQNFGGIAYLNVLCNSNFRYAFSGLHASFQTVPTYSWTVDVFSHETGHNLGSPHTHNCSWNGNNTAIDSCGPTAGYPYEGSCSGAPLPPQGGGTIMSYCHLLGNVGIGFTEGFDAQPANLIANRINSASCIQDCGGGCSYTLGTASGTFPSGSGAGFFNVSSPTGCAWSTTVNAPSLVDTMLAYRMQNIFLPTADPGGNWINITSGSSGTGTGTVNYAVQANGNTTQRTGTITVNGQVHTVTQAGTIAQVTVQTNPAGRSFVVDGTTYTSTQVFNWASGSTHSISAPSPQNATPGTRYVWSNWSDSGSISHTVDPLFNTTLTANFGTEYQLTTASNPANGGTIAPANGSWFLAGQNVQVTATPNSGYNFVNWTGAYTGTDNPATVTMNAPVTQTANFGLIPESVDARGDFDDDGRTDIAVWRPSDGNWHISRSTDGYVAYAWGASGDQITPGDYDNDGNADVAVYRQSTGTWFILNSATSTYSTYTWGGGSDVAVAGDYDDDGMTDVAVRRPSTGEYFILKSSGGTQTSTWGNATDTPVVGDFDGDGQTDLAVWRSSTGEWFINRSTDGTVTVTWGAAGDRVVHADYDGDGKDDVAVWRGSTGTWFILNSNGGTSTYTWGAAGDVPVPGNYDGDARDDIGVFRNGVWHIDRTTGGYLTASWGIGTDRAVPAGYIP